MPGHILEGTRIAVDLWKRDIINTHKVKFFFLTHLHADHIEGLSRTWKNAIYTSPLNAKLLQLNSLISPSLIKVLEIGQSHIITVNRKETFTVTLLDANHCPGSVMFLFEGKFGNILYTGDFCNFPNILPKKLPAIDVLYLDNTYCLDKYQFPEKEDSTKEVVAMSQRCIRNSKLLIIGVDSLGKEDLVVQIAQTLEEKVYMGRKQAEVFRLLGHDHVTVFDPSQAKIHLRQTHQVNRRNMNALNLIKETCAILPTARFMDGQDKRQDKCPGIHIVPYSCHSSFNELRKFVKNVRPKRIMPIVDAHVRGFAGKDLSDRADMTIFKDLCLSTWIDSVSPRNGASDSKSCYESSIDGFNVQERTVIANGSSGKSIAKLKTGNSRGADVDIVELQNNLKNNNNEVMCYPSSPKRHRCIDTEELSNGTCDKLFNNSSSSYRKDIKASESGVASVCQEANREHTSEFARNNVQARKRKTYKITYLDAKSKMVYYMYEGKSSVFDMLFKGNKK